MNAYAQGVNAYIDSLNDQNLPPEFRILQYKPRHWTPADSLAVGKLLAEYLSNSWQLDIMRASLASLPKEKRDALLPERSALDVLVVGQDQAPKRSAGIVPASSSPTTVFDKAILSELASQIDSQQKSSERLGFSNPEMETLRASNNWVVSGKRTITGKPLLANDPHRVIGLCPLRIVAPGGFRPGASRCRDTAGRRARRECRADSPDLRG